MSTNPPPAKKARFSGGKKKQPKMNKKQAKAAAAGIVTGSGDEVLQYSVLELLGQEKVDKITEEGKDSLSPFEHLQEVEVDILALSSHGDGLGMAPGRDWLVAVPFCVPGEKVLAKVYRSDRLVSHADFLGVIAPEQGPSKIRDDSLIGCQYFGRCGGCQYQHIPYEYQLQHKQKVVQDAFKNFSKLDLDLIPQARPTLPSPNTYGYRTKLTPHFEAQPAKLSLPEKQERLSIGFQHKGRRTILDIEECPIATPTINEKLKSERQAVKENIGNYKRGSTLLLRHSLPPTTSKSDAVADNTPFCITKHSEVVREKVAGRDFEFNAGSFFQNNNGILEALVSYVSSELVPGSDSATAPAEQAQAADESTKQYLVDTYCGSGLFAISLAHAFAEVAGVEISGDSVKWAKHNAQLNNVKNASFIEGNAERIFEGIKYPARQTTILIDPPRKGCDDLFLKQLVSFSPAKVLYVSCNVHTQARDVGYLVKEGGYRIDSLRGVDLFSQTYHTEGVCVLSKPE